MPIFDARFLAHDVADQDAGPIAGDAELGHVGAIAQGVAGRVGGDDLGPTVDQIPAVDGHIAVVRIGGGLKLLLGAEYEVTTIGREGRPGFPTRPMVVTSY